MASQSTIYATTTQRTAEDEKADVTNAHENWRAEKYRAWPNEAGVSTYLPASNVPQSRGKIVTVMILILLFRM